MSFIRLQEQICRPRAAAEPGPPGSGVLPNPMSSLTAIGSFLLSKESSEDAEDTVRRLAEAGKLVSELAQYPCIALPRQQRLLVVRPGSVGEDQPNEMWALELEGGTAMSVVMFRSWNSEDDRAEEAREEDEIHAIARDSKTTRLLQNYIEDEIQRDGEQVDSAGDSLSAARKSVDDGVGHLSSAASQHRSGTKVVLKWIVPSVTLGACCTVGAPLVFSGQLTAGGIMFSHGLIIASLSRFCSKAIEKLEEQTLQQLDKQLPRTLLPIPAKEQDSLKAISARAEERLVEALEDSAMWTRRGSVSGGLHGFPISQQASVVREGGFSYATDFEVCAPANIVFDILGDHFRTSSLDPDCNVLFQRPVDHTDKTVGVVARYALFCRLGINREFYTVGNARELPQETSEGASRTLQQHGCSSTVTVEGTRRFVISEVSLPPSHLSKDTTALPRLDTGAELGNMGASGVLITALAGGKSCRVQIMADVDPKFESKLANHASWLLKWSPMTDREVRHHLVHTASNLRKLLEA